HTRSDRDWSSDVCSSDLDAPNRADLEAAIADIAGVPMRVLSGEEEARLAFVGAAATLPRGADGRLVVIDVGGWSTEVVLGTRARSEERRVGKEGRGRWGR